MHKRTALIIDDEPGVAAIVRDVSLECGYETRILPNGAAVDAFASNSDVIVLDLLMPGLDGVDVLRRLAAESSRAQIILMSGMERRLLDSARKVADMQNLNVVGVLQKPFRPGELRKLLTGLGAATAQKGASVSSPEIVVTVEDLARAISEGEIVVHYQPKIAVKDKRWIGVEALARWQHPVYGLLRPDSFIHIAENTRLALPFTYEVARRALADCVMMGKTMGFKGSLAINVPPSALTEVTVPERLVEILEESGFDKAQLLVEITETSIPSLAALSLDIQTRLRMRGIRLSIDDFGTGHSSMERLHDAPFDELKIDMIFVREAEHDPALRLIAESAVTLGHSLDMLVTAEGVESAEALAWLDSIHCDFAQGYYICPPVPLEALSHWARKWMTSESVINSNKQLGAQAIVNSSGVRGGFSLSGNDCS